MIEAGKGQRFFAKPLAGSLVGHATGGKDFDSHVAVEAFVARAVDNTHPACANLFGYEIVPEPLTDHTSGSTGGHCMRGAVRVRDG
jgi:hypothetical protein